ncbi:MAG: DUF2835 family protein [Pseudomonadales bacterium]|nr:DUF2835 family protein [Pseudomonadales bacterium]MCP5183808.1 DUF2835 family protein [Pseudomonadales bacterium]
MARHYIFDFDIPVEEVLKYYAGTARQVRAVSRDGLRVAFPASVLRTHVEQRGLCGTFLLRVSDDNRLLGFERLA